MSSSSRRRSRRHARARAAIRHRNVLERITVSDFNDRAIAAAKAASLPMPSAAQPVPAPPAESATAKQAREEFEQSCRIAFTHWCHKVGLEPGDLEGDLAISASYRAENTFSASRTTSGGSPFSMGYWSTSSPGGHHPGGHAGILKFRIAGHDYVGSFRDFSVVYDGQYRDRSRFEMSILIRENTTDTRRFPRRADTREDIGKALMIEERWLRGERGYP
jgi:hypothetical protein